MKCKMVQRLLKENEELREELRQICHENEMLWRYRTKKEERHTGDGVPYEQLQTEKQRMDWQISEYDLHVKRLEEELNTALEIAATLTAALKRLTRERDGK